MEVTDVCRDEEKVNKLFQMIRNHELKRLNPPPPGNAIPACLRTNIGFANGRYSATLTQVDLMRGFERTWMAVRRALALLASLATLWTSELHGDDFATWSGVFVKTLDTKHLDLITFGQVRFYNNSRDFLQYFVSQRFVVEVNPYLETGINYTYLPTRLSTDVDFWRQHRMELVLTPRWPVTERTTLELRNWLELRWFDGLTGPRERSRHRLGGK